SAACPPDEDQVRRMAARDEVSGIRDAAAQSRQAGAKWHGARLSQLRGPALVMLPGVGHYLPAAVCPRIADEVRAVADRQLATGVGRPGQVRDQ
ncbi:MAG: hypothetical protein ACRDRJ_25150, partial [Streptosporangiaceae bacterium]